MISSKRQVATEDAVAEPEYERELKYLYARRSTIDALIESLEQYERHRETRPIHAELKTA